MSLIPASPVNAPNTTIQIGAVKLHVLIAPDQPIVNVNVRIFDTQGVSISLPRPLEQMTNEERAAMVAALKVAVEAAALPYLDRVLGIGAATHG
jgi:hypothetical protein